MEIVTTHTEAEALLLEANFIKRFKPRFNILLRDDKSFPSILITGDHPFPQVLKHRGARSRKGDYFGPFASAWAVNETLTVLQRAFLLRSCTDAVFAARTRPCLLHQIKRCCAPCDGRIGEEGLCRPGRPGTPFPHRRKPEDPGPSGRPDGGGQRSPRIREGAAEYRDRISALTRVQAHQDINLSGIGTADVIGAHQAGNQTCIQVFFFRAGRNYGNRAYFPEPRPRRRHRRCPGSLPRAVLRRAIHRRRRSCSATGRRTLRWSPRPWPCGPGTGSICRSRSGARSWAWSATPWHQRQGGAQPAPGRERQPAQAAGRLGRDPRPGSPAGTNRGLRQQPYRRHPRGRCHDRRRSRRIHEIGLPQIQHSQHGVGHDADASAERPRRVARRNPLRRRATTTR